VSPSTALQSSVFLFYLAAASGLLALAGLILATLKWGLRRDIEHAWAAFRGWLLIVPVLLTVYFLGRETVIAFVTLVAVVGFREFAHATGLHVDWPMTGAGYAGIVATGATALFGSFELFLAMPVFVIAVVVIVPVLRNRTDGQVRLLGLALLGFAYFGWMLGHLAFLVNADHAYAYLGYVVAAVELNDVAAYVSGKLFGRHLLRSEVSPKKTWEGAAGALAVSLGLPWALKFTLPHFDAIDCVVVGLIVGIGGQMGDLVVSVIKRDVGIKDMGAAIPGHGGILDRIDSLIYVTPLCFHYLRFRHGLTAS